MKCVLPDASYSAPNTMTSASPCESYFEMRSQESELTQAGFQIDAFNSGSRLADGT